MLRGLPLFTAVLLGVATAGPCDIYNGNGTPCGAAHSTVRALLDAYTGGLYQVTRTSDKQTLDIVPLTAGGIANAAAQDKFCKGAASCVISIIYDQSGKGNHLTPAPGLQPAVADRLPIMTGAGTAYGVWIEGGGYRNDNTTGIAMREEPQTIYMVVDATHYNDQCCFNYGNSKIAGTTDDRTMEALYVGSNAKWSYGDGPGPWAMVDLGTGLYSCSDSFCPSVPTLRGRYVTTMLKNRFYGELALKQGKAESKTLEVIFDGSRPRRFRAKQKQGNIVLGIGGDNNNFGVGSFFEGVMVNGDPIDDIDNVVQANIASVFYGGPTAIV